MFDNNNIINLNLSDNFFSEKVVLCSNWYNSIPNKFYLNLHFTAYASAYTRVNVTL